MHQAAKRTAGLFTLDWKLFPGWEEGQRATSSCSARRLLPPLRLTKGSSKREKKSGAVNPASEGRGAEPGGSLWGDSPDVRAPGALRRPTGGVFQLCVPPGSPPPLRHFPPPADQSIQTCTNKVWRLQPLHIFALCIFFWRMQRLTVIFQPPPPSLSLIAALLPFISSC